ncbi:DUF1365 family protein [Epidermidibacterium keratini]|uniref:DUF1365 family protein n=1 Tax=Epidermidibacterium keratini TaxID=1891644 RepID=A0A7L4YL29_9ACTN|nr:DUF1365 domain-containing protein [Epidermidibacterium keratini]QHB99761.1 DUF1365 family protein [Epidermidibacterium keratini]
MSLASTPHLPALVRGTVGHARHGAVAHKFAHSTYLWLIDLDDVPRSLLGRELFRAADHLGDPGASLKENVLRFLTFQGRETDEVQRVVTLTAPRTAGYVFNPLTVHWCLAADGQPVWIVAEVHNTYGERHAYVIDPAELRDGPAEVGKQFYVSPFYEVAGRYRMRFRLRADDVAISIALHDDGADEAKFHAAFRGTPTRARVSRRLLTAARLPLVSIRTQALIRVHGVWLWLRRLPVISRAPHRPPAGV